MLPPLSLNDKTAWHRHGRELATWTLARLVIRRDVWGGYYLTRDGTPSTWTAPRIADRGRVLLGEDLLRWHYRATGRRDVIGTHTTSPGSLSLWGALDIDVHEGSTVSPTATLAAALDWYARLRAMGWRPLLTSSNGKGGYHLRLLLSRPAETPRVYHLLRTLSTDYARHGLTGHPECFPKQPRLDPGRFGNWLRLPGRHHSRDYWSKVWDGSRWLAGQDAVSYLLSLDGDDPDLLPSAPPPPPPPAAPPPWRLVTPPNADRLSRRILGRMARLPRKTAGDGRHGVAFGFAAWLQRDLSLPKAEAMPWLVRWDEGNVPPLGKDELSSIADDALEYGTHAIGSGLVEQPPFSRSRRHRHSIIRVAVEV